MQNFYNQITLVSWMILFTVLAPGLIWAAPPVNDACLDAQPIDNGALSATLTEATEDGASRCDGPGASPDVWFQVSSLVMERLFVNTAGSGIDTVLSVHTACPGTFDNSVTCNDNVAREDLTSQLEFYPEADETYFIRVAGFNGATGPVQLELGPGGGISGTVIDELTGEPLSGITIRSGRSSTQTDLTGRYSLIDLPPGLHRVSFDGSNAFLPQVYDDQPCFPDACDDVENPTLIEVELGEIVEDIDFALFRAGAVTGTLTDAASGEPLVDTQVALELTGGARSWSTRSDDDGRYSFRGLWSGTYFAYTESYDAYRNEIYDDLPCEGSCDISSGDRILVEGGTTTSGIDFALDRLGGISGRITDARTGEPIVNAWVEITNLDGNYYGHGYSDEQGVYTTEGLGSGVYFAIARESAYAGELFEELPCPPEDCEASTGSPIHVDVGTVTADIDFSLEPLGSISGRVTDAQTGEPLTPYLVCVYHGEHFYLVSNTATDTAGFFETVPLETGSYRVGTCDGSSGYREEVYDDVPCPAEDCDPSLGADVGVELGEVTAGIDFALDRLGSISGTVTHATTGGAIPAQLYVRSVDGTVIAAGFSEAFDNHYTITVPPGTYYITAESADFEDELYDDLPCHLGQCDLTRGMPITVALGEEVMGIDFALELRLFGEFTGTVQLRDGSPHSAHVRLYESDGNSYESEYSADGTFRFSRVEPGTYFAVIRDYGFLPVAYDGVPCPSPCDATTGTPIEVLGDETTTGIDFVLDELPTLTGTVLDAESGEPISDVRIELYDQDRYVTSTRNNGDGSYEFQHILPGTYFALAYSPSHLPQRYAGLPCPPEDCDPTAGTPISLEVNETLTGIDFMLTLGGSLSGSLRDQESLDTISGTLTLWDAAGVEVATTFTDSYGRFFFAGLAAGTYYVGARAHAHYLEEVYEDIPCPRLACDPTTGTPIEVRLGKEESKIDFSLLPLAGQPCTPSLTTLCLNGGRFKVEAGWQDSSGDSGDGTAQMLTSDSGYFWFFNDDNVELIVKLLDACFEPYDRFWFFVAGLTDVEVELTVTDTSSGEVKTYRNPLGESFQPILDTAAFNTCPSATGGATASGAETRPWRATWPSVTLSSGEQAGTCQPGTATHCLNQGRFQVEAWWQTADDRSGQGLAALALDDTGFYWFFGPDNIELVIKVLDACTLEPFHSFWVFAAGLTDVDVVLRVTDTVSGEVREYHNPQGVPFSPIQDTQAFKTCDP